MRTITIYVVFQESLEGPDTLYAITGTEREARLLLDAPNFDLRIDVVTLDESGMVVAQEELIK